MKEIQLTQGKVALVDDEDYEYLNQWKWYANKLGNKFYAVRNLRINKKYVGSILMHRLVANNNSKMHTDHCNGDSLDNRKENLRICNASENLMNQKKHLNNKSGYKGVGKYNNNKSKFRSQISCNGKFIHLGYYKTKEDAAKAYNAAAIKYHGEFANLNKIEI
jgi:hypothetical protein